MRRRVFLSIVFGSLIALLALPGCSVVRIARSSGPVQAAPAPVVQAQPAETVIVVTNSGEIQPTPGSTLAGDNLTVTLDDQGKTLELERGQRFLLNLGGGYDWTPVVANPAVVSRVVGITVIRGAQGVYEAHSAGQTTLTVTGDPPCRQSKPACMLPSRQFTIALLVR